MENQYSERDRKYLQLIKKMIQAVDAGYNVEFRKTPEGGYKALKCKKEIIKWG